MRHGTATGWRHHKCRCPACHRALLAQGKVAWAAGRLRAGADPSTRVRPENARRHVEELIASGMSAHAVAKAAGVDPSTVSKLRDPSTKRISRIVARAVLEVSAHQSTRMRPDLARRHVEELVAAGMSANAVARAAGVSESTVRNIRNPSTKRISRIVARAVLGVVP